MSVSINVIDIADSILNRIKELKMTKVIRVMKEDLCQSERTPR